MLVIHLIEKKRVLKCMNGSSGKIIAPILHLLPDSCLSIQCKVYSDRQGSQGGHSIVKNTGGAGSIVWGLGSWLGKIFWGSTKILIWTIVRG